jgi:hypothetical protein
MGQALGRSAAGQGKDLPTLSKPAEDLLNAVAGNDDLSLAFNTGIVGSEELAKATMNCGESAALVAECLEKHPNDGEVSCYDVSFDNILCNFEQLQPQQFAALQDKCAKNFQSDECSALLTKAELFVEKAHQDAFANIAPMSAPESESLMKCGGNDFGGVAICAMKRLETSPAYKDFESCFNANNGNLSKCEKEGSALLGGVGRHIGSALRVLQDQGTHH